MSGRRRSDALLLIQSILSNNHSSTNVHDIMRQRRRRSHAAGGSERPLKAVAYHCGFGTADRMRVVFSERLGVTPSDPRAVSRRSWHPSLRKGSANQNRCRRGRDSSPARAQTPKTQENKARRIPGSSSVYHPCVPQDDAMASFFWTEISRAISRRKLFVRTNAATGITGPPNKTSCAFVGKGKPASDGRVWLLAAVALMI